MNQDELDKVLDLHKKWLNSEEGGVRADLSLADLRGANLSKANLSWANLSRANLSRADLSEANLRWADLYGANLSRANLSRATLSRANLYGANLSEANLRWANLKGADLSWANLYGADLDYSCWDLSCKTLHVKADAKIVGQLLYHALMLAHNSGVEISTIEDVIELANNSSPVMKHACSKLHLKGV